MNARGDFGSYRRPTPPPPGGIKARSRRGPIGETWWSRTFITVLEESSIGGRLARGKNYARSGRVLSLRFAAGEVTGVVQGSELNPYDVIVSFDRLTDDDAAALAEAVARVPFLVAGMTGGTLPVELNQVAERLDIHLLPHGPADVHFSCTCPDWGEPCKHASAVTYLLAEHLDVEPFDLLTLHGVDRDAFVEQVIGLSALTSGEPDGLGAGAKARTGGETAPGPAVERPESTAADAASEHAAAPPTGDEPQPEPAPLTDEPAWHFRAAGTFPRPGPGARTASGGAATALDVLDHRLLTPRGPSIKFWLGPHYEALTKAQPPADRV